LTATRDSLYNPVMSGIEWRGISPEEMIRENQAPVKQYRENKYAFQTGIRDLDFDIDEGKIKIFRMILPFHSISQAEEALCNHVIQPAKFIEDDRTEHLVLVFDHRPVGYSGYMDCVTHSLALTNHGLFELGRYSAVGLSAPGHYWQWFLHRRLATTEDVYDYCESQTLSNEQFMKDVYQAMIQG
jgi:hypothetical protein